MNMKRLFVPALAAAILLPAAAAADTKITFFYWAGSNQGVVPQEVIDAYVSAHPDVTVDVIESTNQLTYPKMVAARRTTPDEPLVNCGFFNTDIANKGDVDDMWESLDPAMIPNMNNVLENYRRPGDRGVGFQTSTIGLLYNKDAMPAPPDSWSALWDEANRGRVVMFDYDTRVVAMAARLNGGDEVNADPGFAVWAENAKNIRALVDTNDALKNLLVSGDAWVAPWFSSIAKVWIDEGAPVAMAVPKEGAIAFPFYLMIGKGSSPDQIKVCSDLINDLLSPENAARYGELTFAIPVVSNAPQTEEQMNNPITSLKTAESAVHLDFAAIAKQAAEWRERWDREVKINLR